MTAPRPPGWFWAAAGLLFLWNLMGLTAFFYDGMITEEAIAQLPADHQALYRARPSWVVAAFALAVSTGTAGSIALLMRRKVALGLFVASILGVLVQDSWFFIGGVMEVMGTEALIMPALVIGSLVAGIVITRRGSDQGWIR